MVRGRLDRAKAASSRRVGSVGFANLDPGSTGTLSGERANPTTKKPSRAKRRATARPSPGPIPITAAASLWRMNVSFGLPTSTLRVLGGDLNAVKGSR